MYIQGHPEAGCLERKNGRSHGKVACRKAPNGLSERVMQQQQSGRNRREGEEERKRQKDQEEDVAKVEIQTDSKSGLTREGSKENGHEGEKSRECQSGRGNTSGIHGQLDKQKAHGSCIKKFKERAKASEGVLKEDQLSKDQHKRSEQAERREGQKGRDQAFCWTVVACG